MFSPIRTMFTYFPIRAWTTVLVLLAISCYSFRQNRRKWKARTLTDAQAVSRWLLVSYVLLLLFFTVLGRRTKDLYRFNFDIGYSFRDAISNGTPETIRLILVNIAIFLPVGFFAFLSAQGKEFPKALSFGVMLTIVIELSQLLLRNGTCEIDDLISNTLGTLLGIALALLTRTYIQHLLSILTHRPTPDDPRWVYYEIEPIEGM